MAKDKDKKKFKETLVGSGLIGIASLINPALGGILDGALNVGDAIKMIGQSDVTADEKVMLQEFALKQYEAEVQDRATARQREALVAASGGSDILFKTIGWTISLTFLAVVAGAVGLWEVPEESQRLFDMGFGAVVAMMTSVVSYYFGSSSGSKAKTQMMSNQHQ